MGLYNFKEQFVPFILSGEKTHTIRAVRRHPDKPGNTLYLYTGLRTKRAKLLMRVDCVKVEDIEIRQRIEDFANPYTGYHEHVEWFVVRVNDDELTGDEREQLARRDGFSSFAKMMKFWTVPKNRLPFIGNIIHWRRKESHAARTSKNSRA